MGAWQDIRSIFINDYRDGARDVSTRPIIFLDPKKLKVEGEEEALKKKTEEYIKETFGIDVNAPDASEKMNEVLVALQADPEKLEQVAKKYQKIVDDNKTEFRDRHAEKIRTAIEEQHPELAGKLSQDELFAIVDAADADGEPSAQIISVQGNQMCVITDSSSDALNKDELFSVIAKPPSGGKREVPGWQDHWERVIGRHEGEHCNQPTIDISKPFDDIMFQKFKNEVGADKKAIEFLKERGLTEELQAYKDWRALNAVDRGDFVHASKYLLDHPDVEPTMEHMKAASLAKESMIADMERATGMSAIDLQRMKREEPRKFMDKVDELLKEGKMGLSRYATADEQEQLIAAELGMSQEEMIAAKMNLTDEALADFNEKYFQAVEKLQSSGAFIKPVNNPYVKDNIQDYTQAYRRQILDRPEPAPKPVRHGPRADASDATAPESVAVASTTLDTVEPTVAAKDGPVSEAAVAEVVASEPTIVKPEESPAASTSTLASYQAKGGHYDYIDLAEIDGGDPVVVLDEGDRAQMTIGGVSASSFFASHADPVLAEQRITRENTPEVSPAVYTYDQSYNRSAPGISA